MFMDGKKPAFSPWGQPSPVLYSVRSFLASLTAASPSAHESKRSVKSPKFSHCMVDALEADGGHNVN